MAENGCPESGLRIRVSVGVCAYNEARNIQRLLDSLIRQKTARVLIEEIIIISGGSTDETDEIVKNFPGDGKVRLIKQKERGGKYAAINVFLKIARSAVLVLTSADIILDEKAVENLCSPFRDNDLGMTGARPIPIDSADVFAGYLTNLQWYLHHQIALIQPKFGELVAFRNIINSVPPTLTDEEQIACIIKTGGYKLKYIPEAVINNKGPENLKDFFIQRRRIYAGHLTLKKKYNYEAATFKGLRILRHVRADLPPELKKNKCWLFRAIILEAIARGLARADICFKGKRNNYKWEIAGSTKDLVK